MALMCLEACARVCQVTRRSGFGNQVSSTIVAEISSTALSASQVIDELDHGSEIDGGGRNYCAGFFSAGLPIFGCASSQALSSPSSEEAP